MSEKMKVESFNLDHRLVQAPYVRVADKKKLDPEITLIKYDIRFCQPNQEHLSGEAIHSIEHLVAESMRDFTDKLIDFSPMGCRTGFYAILNNVDYEEFLVILARTLTKVMTATSVPAANEIQCGWGAYHSLAAAKTEISNFLAHQANWKKIYRDEAKKS